MGDEVEEKSGKKQWNHKTSDASRNFELARYTKVNKKEIELYQKMSEEAKERHKKALEETLEISQ